MGRIKLLRAGLSVTKAIQGAIIVTSATWRVKCRGGYALAKSGTASDATTTISRPADQPAKRAVAL
jgi:hypothetical protein